jgi:hypothetical protein
VISINGDLFIRTQAAIRNGLGSVPLTIAREYIAITLVNAEQAGAPEATIARIKKLKQDAQANGFNVGLLADIWLLAIWFAVLTVLIVHRLVSRPRQHDELLRSYLV